VERIPALLVAVAACSSQPKAEPPHHDAQHDHEKHHAHRFDDAEAWAKEFDDPSRDEWQKPDEVVRAMALSPGMVVADLGAGTGYFLGRLSRAVGPDGKVLALDVEASMVEHMKKRAAAEGLANVEARAVAPDDPNLAPASVDRILVVNTWHHLPERDRYAVKLAAALKAGGELWIVDFTKESPRGPPAEFRFPPQEVMGALSGASLEPSLVEESLPHQFIVKAVRRH
jgi:cyclopropane fatty-acyl-phospholipid synthase-like methyltransferase